VRTGRRLFALLAGDGDRIRDLGITPVEHLSVVQYLVGMTPNREYLQTAALKFHSHTYTEVYFNLVWINLMWGLVKPSSDSSARRWTSQRDRLLEIRSL